jgi:ubiquinone/menaquinone biosynthesis C-methylase UbiE
MCASYVHGYSDKEATRLYDQAETLVDMLHNDTHYPAGSRVLEAGCGVGAQTVALARSSPEAIINAVDISLASLRTASDRIEAQGAKNVTFQHADIFDLHFEDGAFDHIFVCYVLEHLESPLTALDCLKRVLKPNGSMTVIEGDHGSCFFHPESPFARKAIDALVACQAKKGGNALVGRELFPLMRMAGFRDIRVSPRMVYVDDSRPELVEGFTKKTFTAMVEGVREQAIGQGLITEGEFDRGVNDLYRTAQSDGTFCYTFFKAVGWK